MPVMFDMGTDNESLWNDRHVPLSQRMLVHCSCYHRQCAASVPAASCTPQPALQLVPRACFRLPAVDSPRFYMGLKHQRLKGDAYYEMLDEFMFAIFNR